MDDKGRNVSTLIVFLLTILDHVMLLCHHHLVRAVTIMPITTKYSVPETSLIAWFTRDSEGLDATTRLRLLAGPFTSGQALLVAGCNTMLICAVALYLHPNRIFLAWLCVDALVWILRVLLFRRCNSSAKAPLKYATDLSILLGLAWAAEIGLGTAACILSGDGVLQILACTSAVSMNGAIAMRNQGIPRYAFVQILLTDVPLKIATLFQPEPMLRILIIQAPFYLTGMWCLLSSLNSSLIKAYEAEVSSSHSANHDSLTGLLNRSGLLMTLDGLLRSPREHHHPISLLYLDLDGFKAVNDRHGHAAGDEALIMFAKLLRGTVRASDFTARLGGDEFVVVLQGPESDASPTANRIIQLFQECCASNALLQGLGVSVGIAFGASNGLYTPQSLISRADAALYKAKSAGKGCFRYAF